MALGIPRGGAGVTAVMAPPIIMTRTMSASARRVACFAAALAALFAMAPPWAAADHGGVLRSAPMSPLAVGLIAAVLALVAGGAVLVIARLLVRRRPPPG